MILHTINIKEGNKHIPEKWIQISQIQTFRLMKHFNTTKITGFCFEKPLMVQILNQETVRHVLARRSVLPSLL